MIVLVIEAPELYQGVHRRVKHPLGIPGQIQGAFQKGSRIRGKHHGFFPVQAADVAAVAADAQKAVQPLDFRHRFFQSLIPVWAVGRQGHDRIHGGEIPGRSRRFPGGPAAGEQKKTQEYSENSFHKAPFLFTL